MSTDRDPFVFARATCEKMRVRERREPGARRRHQERAREAARRRAGSRDRSCGRSCERTAARAAKRGSPTPQQAVAAVARRGSAPVVRAAASAAATLARARRRAIWRPHTRARAVLARRGCARRERRVPARDLARRVRAGYRRAVRPKTDLHLNHGRDVLKRGLVAHGRASMRGDVHVARYMQPKPQPRLVPQSSSKQAFTLTVEQGRATEGARARAWVL